MSHVIPPKDSPINKVGLGTWTKRINLICGTTPTHDNLENITVALQVPIVTICHMVCLRLKGLKPIVGLLPAPNSFISFPSQ